MSERLEPLPYDAPMVNADRTVSADWYRYLSAVLLDRLQNVAFVAKAVRRLAQGAAIGATALSTGSAGLYRVSWYLRITQAATTSSSATVTIAATDGGVNVSQSGAAVTGNTPTTVQTGSVQVQADAATPITFAVAYASVGATPMLYAISVSIEQVN